VSLIRTERLSVALCADRVGLIWRIGHAGEQSQVLTTSRADTARDGMPALDALQGWLADAKPRKLRLSVTLSAGLVRYALIPWPGSNLTQTEDAAWLRLQFEALHGDMTGWRIQSDPGGYGRARVACAVPEATLARLRDMGRANRLKTQAIVPYFVHCWNRWRRGGTKPAGLFGVSESDRVVWASYGPAGWAGLRTGIARAGIVEMPQLAQRERVLQGQTDGAPFHLHVAGHNAHASAAAADGTHIRWLTSKATDEPDAIAMARLLAAP